MTASRSIGNILNSRPVRYFITILPIGSFFWFFFRYSINIPHWDDFDVILSRLLMFLEAENLKDKIALLFRQHNEHRPAFDQLVTVITYFLNGSVNFKWLMLVGNISLLGLLAILFLSFKEGQNKCLYFMPVSYLLFQPQYWENIYWGMASIANLCVLFFAFLSLYLVTKQSQKKFLFATAFAVLATFTSGSGMFVFLVGLAILIYQKRFKNAVLWLIVMGISSVFYFHDYVKPPHHPSILDAVFRQPGDTIDYLFSFVGSSLFLPHQMGLLPFVALIYLTKQKYYKNNLALYSYLIFLSVTSIAVALTRSGLGIEQAFSSRYKIISILFLIVLYIAAAENVDRERWLKRYFPLMFAFAIAFSLVSYFSNYKHIAGHRRDLIFGVLQWQSKVNGLSYPDASRAGKILEESIQRNIYSVPRINSQEITSHTRDFSLPQETNNLSFAFDLQQNDSSVTINGGWAYINGQSSENTEIYVVLKSDKGIHIFDTQKQKRPDVTAFFKTLNFDDSGFSVLILEKGLERGTYQVGFYIRKGKIEALQYTGKTITIH